MQQQTGRFRKTNDDAMPRNGFERQLCLFWHGIFDGKKYPVAFYTKKERQSLAREVLSASRQYYNSGNASESDRLSRHFEYINAFMKLKNEHPGAKVNGNARLITNFLRLLYFGKTPSAFWNYFLKKYRLRPRSSPLSFWDYFDEFQPKRMAISGWLSKHAKGKILDVGAGAHSYIPVHTACDISSRALAKNRFAKHKKAIKPDARRLPFASLSFDTIMLNSVLAYVDDWHALFSKCRRILKAGGILLITNAPINEYHPAKYFEVSDVRANRLRRILSSSGFAVLDKSAENKTLFICKK